jgi:transcriptional regulator with XRE-family HTH domain
MPSQSIGATMPTVDPRFRGALVALLMESGVSQNRVAASAHVSRSYLSQLVNGERSPSRAVAEALDDALGAGGSLVAFVSLGVDADARDLLARVATHPRRVSPESIAGLARLLAAQRGLDDTLGAARIVESVTATADTVAVMVREVTGPTRPALVSVAAQWAQFAAWLHMSVGRWAPTRTWLANAAEWAAETADEDLIATVVSFQAHHAWLECRWAPAVGLAEAAARSSRIYPAQRAYDQYAAARSHAALGDLDDAERLIAAADQAAEQIAEWAGPVAPWHYYRAPWQWAAERGLARLYMARWDQRHAAAAVRDLAAGVAGIPAEQAGADWAAEYMAQLAAAHMHAGELDAAGDVLVRAGVIARQTASPRVLRLVKTRERRLDVLNGDRSTPSTP